MLFKNFICFFLKHFTSFCQNIRTTGINEIASSETNKTDYDDYICGMPKKEPTLNQSIGEIGDAPPDNWPWLVNICINDYGELNCVSYSGLVVGNEGEWGTNWVLAMIETSVKAEDLLVVSAVDNTSQINNFHLARYHMVKQILRYDHVEPPIDFPVLTLLELYQPLIFDVRKPMTSICLPKMSADGEASEIRRFNNTPMWTAGWSYDNYWNISNQVRQFHVELFFTNPENYTASDIPKTNEKFIVGTPIMVQMQRGNMEGSSTHPRWYIYGGLWFSEDMNIFVQINVYCDWIAEMTNKVVRCI